MKSDDRQMLKDSAALRVTAFHTMTGMALHGSRCGSPFFGHVQSTQSSKHISLKACLHWPLPVAEGLSARWPPFC